MHPALLILLLAFTIPGRVRAQAPLSITGTLLDPSGSVVPLATVRLLSVSGPERKTDTLINGEFAFLNLTPGDYELRVALPAFEPLSRKIRLGSRSTAVTLSLNMAARKDEVTILATDRRVTIDPSQNADTISVERSMLDNLPVLDLNYLATLQRFLDPGSPGGAGVSLIVDGMESRNVGVTASAIQEIRINNNPYTAEFPRWSRRRIEVITKSATDAYHGTFNFLFRDHHLNARDTFAASRPPDQRRIFEGSLFGPIASGKKASFLLSGAREDERLQMIVFAQGPAGPIQQNVAAPQVNTFFSGRISYQPGERQSMFFQQNLQDRWQNNSGVGGTTLAEAGSHTRFREDEFIFNHRYTLSPKLLSQFRLLIGRYWAPTQPNLQAAKVIVSDAFTGGGAQSERLSTEFHASITWLLTQTVGRHSFKYGFNVPDWSRRGLTDRTNNLGTLSFASLADLAAGRPFAAVLQRGDPRTIFIEKNVGWFLQDEWQLRSNLSVALGLRYDWQNYFGDTNNWGPRLAIAYSPRKTKNLVIRSGIGLFSERSGPGPIFDILRYDGFHLNRYVLSGSAIPQGPVGLAPSIHQLSPHAGLPNALQFSFGFERQLAKKTTLAVNYVGVRASQQFRSRDANAPLPPAFLYRPDPAFNVLRLIESAGRVEGNSLEITVRGNLSSKVTGTLQYVLNKSMTDTGGVLWFPAASYNPSGEWGRADTDRRHQFNFLGTAALHRWANFGLSASLLSSVPYNITTGRDENRDGMPLDRPPGAARNTGLGPNLAVIDLRWYHDFRLRPGRKDKSPSLTLSLDAFNIFNRVNYQNYIGALTSPFFGRAVSAQPARRLQAGFRYQF